MPRNAGKYWISSSPLLIFPVDVIRASRSGEIGIISVIRHSDSVAFF